MLFGLLEFAYMKYFMVHIFEHHAHEVIEIYKEVLQKDINFPKIENIDCSNMNELISNLLTKTVNKRNC